MKFSKAIRMALRGENHLSCPICEEHCKRAGLPFVAGNCGCPVSGRVMHGLFGRSRLRPTSCYKWGRKARRVPDSPERHAAEEIILCLEAQDD
jgi:hypothetical protein